jgi:hypothetical protein
MKSLLLQMKTQVLIDATPEEVWEVLAALESYSEWNPAIVAASGDLRAGRRLKLRFEPRGSRGYTFRPELMVVDPPYELRWLGWPRLPLVFDTEHYFAIEALSSRTSRVDHGLLAYGLLAPLAARTIHRATKRHFEKMNEALKQRVETLTRGSEYA